MKPPKSIFDKSFKYRDSASTDVRKTFERIRAEQKKKAEALAHVLVSIQRKKSA